MSPKDSGIRISDLMLEKFILGELPEGERVSLEAQILASPATRARVEALQQSNAEFARRFPAKTMTAAIRRKAENPRAKDSSKLFWSWTMALVPVAALLLIIVRPIMNPPEERTKGLTTGLHVYRKNGSSLEKLAHGSSVRSNDLVQLSYSVEHLQYGMAVSIDGSQQVTLHWPESSGVSPELTPGREIALPSSFELDASPKFETFVLITSDKPFDTAPILKRVHLSSIDSKTGEIDLTLPAGLNASVITLRKTP